MPRIPEKTRVILGLGSGNDLRGFDYTRPPCAPCRTPCTTARSPSSARSCIDKKTLDVEVTIGVQRPERVDIEKVKASLPFGNVTIKAVKGGLDIADPDNNDHVSPAPPSPSAST